MRSFLLLSFWLAVPGLVAAAENYTTCMGFAQAAVACSSATTAGTSACCAPFTALATKCDGMHGLLANSYFNTPYADIGFLLSPPKECKPFSPDVCLPAAANFTACTLGEFHGRSRLNFAVLSPLTVGSFKFTTAVAGSAGGITTAPIAANATSATIVAALKAAFGSNTPGLMFESALVIRSTAAGSSSYVQLLQYGIPATTSPKLSLVGTDLVPVVNVPVAGVLGEIVNAPLPAGNATRCCEQSMVVETVCTNYQFDNSSSPDYQLPMPVNFTDNAFGSYLMRAHGSCPSASPSDCYSATYLFKSCAMSPATSTRNGCCDFIRVMNSTCNTYTRPGGFNATEMDVMNRLLANPMCTKDYYGGGGSSGNSTTGNSCAAASANTIPQVFMYTQANGTQVPVTPVCNPTNPTDASFGKQCVPIFTFNSKTYFLHHALNAAPGTFAATGCVAPL